jgi:hypothetical protein
MQPYVFLNVVLKFHLKHKKVQSRLWKVISCLQLKAYKKCNLKEDNMIQKLQRRLMNIASYLNNLDLVKKCLLHLSWKIHQAIVIFQIQLHLHQINIVKLNIGFVQLMNTYKWVILQILLVYRPKKID